MKKARENVVFLFLAIQRETNLTTMKVSKKKYDGMRDLQDHVVQIQATLNLFGTIDAIKCKNFPLTLKGMITSTWFYYLPYVL